MTWLLIFSLAGVVFLNRYLLLEPRVPVRIPPLVQQALHYSAPCLLTAICGPILLQNQDIPQLIHSPYVYATLLSILFALLINNILLSVLLSLATFYGLLWIFF